MIFINEEKNTHEALCKDSGAQDLLPDPEHL